MVTVYRLRIHTSLQGVALWRLVAASDARPADMRWFWTGTVFMGCKETCWLRILLTCSSRSPAGETDKTHRCAPLSLYWLTVRQNLTNHLYITSWRFRDRFCLSAEAVFNLVVWWQEIYQWLLSQRAGVDDGMFLFVVIYLHRRFTKSE